MADAEDSNICNEEDDGWREDEAVGRRPVYNPLTPFPNSRACQLSWSRRWFSRFEGQVPCSNHAGTNLFTSLHFSNYFHNFISAFKNHQKLFFFLHYFQKIFI